MSTSLRPTAQWLRWLALAMLLVGCYYLGNYGLTLASPTAQPSTPAVVSALPAPDASPMVNEAAAPATDLAPASSPRKLASAQGNAFNAILWLRPPPPAVVHPAVAPPPPPPAAPSLPYTFVGLLTRKSTQPQAFIARGESLLMVSTGDLLDNNTYRVDAISDQEIQITYLPMNTRHTLTVTGGTP